VLHLKSCERCRHEFDMLSRIDLAMTSLGVASAPTRMRDAVMREIERSARANRRAGTAVAVTTACAVVYAVVTPLNLGLGWLTPQRLEGTWKIVSDAFGRFSGFVASRSPAIVEGPPVLSGEGVLLYAVAGAVVTFLVFEAVKLSRDLAADWHSDSYVSPR
jgi:hypothetical protein